MNGVLSFLDVAGAWFLKVLNMSITASYVILAVLLVRFIVRTLFPQVPKKYMYWLWIVVAFRLASPWSLESQWSLFQWALFDMKPVQQMGSLELEYFSEEALFAEGEHISVGIPGVDEALHEGGEILVEWLTQDQQKFAHQMFFHAGRLVWIVGVIVLGMYGIVSYLRLHRCMEKAVLLRDNIYQSEVVRSPFILGFRNPKIYIPFHLRESDLNYVLAHEQAHIRRRDHLIKPIACLLLSLHWFNPLVWISFAGMCKDMELSCDEEVLSQGAMIRKAYSETLLYLATYQKHFVYSPLAFGENSVKARIKNALHWQGPTLSTTIGTGIACILVVILCAANPIKPTPKEDIFGKYYANPDDVFDSLMYFTKDDLRISNRIFYITESGELLMERRSGLPEDPVEWLYLGVLEEISLTRDNFSDYFYYNGGSRPGNWFDHGDQLVPTRQASYYRQNNWKAWRVIVDSRMIYLLQQRDGNVYYAYGYYDVEGETDPNSDDSEVYIFQRLAERNSEELTRWGVILVEDYEWEDIVPWDPEEEIRQALEQQETNGTKVP